MAWEIAMAGADGTAGESSRRGTNIWPDTGGGWINGRGDDTQSMLKGYEHMVDFFTSFLASTVARISLAMRVATSRPTPRSSTANSSPP